MWHLAIDISTSQLCSRVRQLQGLMCMNGYFVYHRVIICLLIYTVDEWRWGFVKLKYILISFALQHSKVIEGYSLWTDVYIHISAPLLPQSPSKHNIAFRMLAERCDYWSWKSGGGSLVAAPVHWLTRSVKRGGHFYCLIAPPPYIMMD